MLFLKIFIAAFMLAVAGCKKDTAAMMVVKDCTGAYLRFESRDYHVCNKEKLEGFANGAAVEAAFEKTGACPADSGIVCMMLHENEGWVKVTKIKQ